MGQGNLGIFQDIVAARILLLIKQCDPQRGRDDDLALGEGHGSCHGTAHQIGEGRDALGFTLGHQDDREIIATEAGQSVLRAQQAAQPTRNIEQDGIPHREADTLVDLLEAIQIEHQHSRTNALVGARKDQRCIKPVHEQFAVGQAGQIVMHRIMQEPLFGGLDAGDIGQGAYDPHDLVVIADHGPGFERIPEEFALSRAQAKIQCDAPAPLVEDRIQCCPVAIPVQRMDHLHPWAWTTVQ